MTGDEEKGTAEQANDACRESGHQVSGEHAQLSTHASSAVIRCSSS